MRATPLALALVIAAGVVPLASEQGGFRMAYDPAVHNVPYTGQFTFARLRYSVAPGGYYYLGLPAWAHGFRHAEDNLARILDAITAVKPRLDASNVFDLNDPDLCRFPVAYMTEAGFWELTDPEAKAFRAYLLKGGFVIFDDFRDPPRGGGGWAQFEANMHRILPSARVVDLTPQDPIFHVFFDIDSFDLVPQYYDTAVRPVFRGIYEDNDPHKRLLAIINFNTDIANFWEFSGSDLKPVSETNEAYELGVNYIIYGLTH